MQADKLYADSRARIAALVRSGDVTRPVPGCPGWTVHDVVAHLVGLAVDVPAGRTEAMPPTPEWTARQVAERAGRSVDELLAEWEASAPALEHILSEATRIVPPVVDILTHEHDIRGALGEPPSDYDYALQGYVLGLDYRLRKLGLPALRVRAGEEEWELGEGEPAATVTTTRYELFRALAGRRSEAQVRAFQWDGDPAPYLPVLSTFGPLAAADVDD